MRVHGITGGAGNPLGSSLRILPTRGLPGQTLGGSGLEQLNLLGSLLLELQERLEELRRSVQASRTRGLRGWTGADDWVRSTRLWSREEVISTRPTLVPQEPTSTLGSSTPVTLAQLPPDAVEPGRLTLDVVQGGVVGEDELRLELRDGAGELLDPVRVLESYVPGDPITLASGLQLRLGSGELLEDDRIVLPVVSSTDGTHDPTRPYTEQGPTGGVFDPGHEVRDGSFVVNGTVIQVFATDTTNDLLERLEARVEGLRASFDGETDTVLLEQAAKPEQPAEEPPELVLKDDTCGVLAALKLAGARPRPDLSDVSLADLPGLDHLAKGHLLIDGERIQVNPKKDTLGALIERVSARTDGVEAGLDPHTGALVFRREDGRQVQPAGDSSGLTRTLDGRRRLPRGLVHGLRERLVLGDPERLREDLKGLVGAFERLGDTPLKGAAQAKQGRAQELLRGAFRGALRDLVEARGGRPLERELGLRMGAGKDDPLELDEERLEKSARIDGQDLFDLLHGAGRSDRPGLVERLGQALEQAKDILVELLGGADALSARLDVQG